MLSCVQNLEIVGLSKPWSIVRFDWTIAIQYRCSGIKLISKSEMNQRNILILSLSLSFGIGLYAFPEFVAHVPDLGIKLGLLLTTGLIPAGLLAFILNATLPKKSK